MTDRVPHTDKRVLITGGSSGIGAATARLLACGGAHVAVHYNRRKKEAEQICNEMERSGRRAIPLQADLTDPASARILIDEAIRQLGGLDSLVNNAGGMKVRPVMELTHMEWHDAFALNVEAPFFLSQRAIEHMRANGGGRIVNISSIGVKYGGSPTSLHYSAAKAALEAITGSLAKFGAPFGILVNAIRPGIIDTAFHSETSAEQMEKRVAMIPLKRAGQPEEVAEMIKYLLSPAGDFITGQIFAVSGGD